MAEANGRKLCFGAAGKQQIDNRPAGRRIKVAGRLVSEDQRRARGQGAGNGTRCCSPPESCEG